MLAVAKTKQRSAYIDFVSKGETEEIERFYSLKNLPSILGGKSFKEYIREKFNDKVNRLEIPESKELAPAVEKVISAVCEHYRVSKTELMESRRGVENIRRDVAIYLVRCLCRLTLPLVGREFGIENYSSVSSAVQRVKLRLESDTRLGEDLMQITKTSTKSQKRTCPLHLKAKAAGVKDVCFSKGRGLDEEEMYRSRRVYKGLRNYRAGIESGISWLKRSLGLKDAYSKGLSRSKVTFGHP